MNTIIKFGAIGIGLGVTGYVGAIIIQQMRIRRQLNDLKKLTEIGKQLEELTSFANILNYQLKKYTNEEERKPS